MSVRDDVTIDWPVSPRIIEISKDGSFPTLITIQDLYDTVRDLASKEESLVYDEIIDAGGKETLSSTEKVVLTVTLKNAKIKFEARTSWTVCEIIGGNVVAVDVNGDPMNPIEPSPYVNVVMAKSSAGVAIETGVSGLTEKESQQLKKTLTVAKFLALQ